MSTIIGTAADERIDGGAGADLLVGKGGDDIIFAREGADTVRGGAGKDYLLGDGLDLFDGGKGADHATLEINSSSDLTVDLAAIAAGADYALEEGGLLSSIEQLSLTINGDGANHLIGYRFRDFLQGGWGGDTVEGAGGDDALYGGETSDGFDDQVADTIDGGRGSDYLEGGVGDTYLGGAGLDVAVVNGVPATSDGVTVLVGDLAAGGSVDAGAGTILQGIEMLDFTAGAGDDRLVGFRYSDTLSGGAGNDTVYGGGGDDTLLGGTGDNLVKGQNGADLIFGDDGNDTILGGDGDDIALGAGGFDRLDGGEGNDALHTAFDGGSDTLSGGAGKDTLTSGNAVDVLYGGDGADELHGGLEDDIFIYRFATESTATRYDSVFTDAHDVFDLAAIDADKHQDGDQAFTLVDAFTGQAGELAIVRADSGLYFIQGDIDGDGTADLSINIVAANDAGRDVDFVL